MIHRALSAFAALFLLTGVTATGARADGILSTVLARGTIRVAIVPSNPPWCSVDPSGSLQGYDVDIANALGKALGVQVEFVRTDTAGRVAQLQTHKVDVTISNFTPTLDRMKTIAFTDPYAIDDGQVLVPSASPVKDLGDFPKGAKIGVTRGGTMESAIAQSAPQTNIVEFPGNADLMQAIQSQQMDAIAANNGMISEILKRSNGKYRVLPYVAAIEKDAIGLPQGHFTWWMWLNQFVHQINSDGTNYTLYTEWFGYEPPKFVSRPLP